MEGFDFIGIEQDAAYVDIAVARIPGGLAVPSDKPRPIEHDETLPLFNGMLEPRGIEK